MKNKKKSILSIIAIVILVAGLAVSAGGVYGQNIYDTTTAMVGCKKPDTMGIILDPTLLTEIPRGQSPDALKGFLSGTLGLPSDAVNPAVDARSVYDAAASDASDDAKFTTYLTTDYVPAAPATDAAAPATDAAPAKLTQDEAAALIKDKALAGPAREQMVKAQVTSQLGLDEAQYQALASDSQVIALMQEGLPNLTKGGFTGFLFTNSVVLLFSGIILIVLAAAYFLLRAMDSTGRGKAKTHVAAEGDTSQKVMNFLLNYALYIILGAILVAVSIMKPNFLDISNILNILKQASTKGILALGCAGLIVLAGTDLSIGRVLGLSAAMTASLVQSASYASRMFPQITSPLPLILPLLVSITVAVIFSLINGFGVSKLHLHAFIVTLGTQLIAQGATCIYIESQPSGTAQALSTFDRGFLNAAAGSFDMGAFKIPYVVIYFLILAVIMWVIWNKTKLGKNMFAVGGNEEAAAVSGVNVAKTIMLVYLIAGVLYGISAFLEAARITSVGANTGLNYELDAISACVVGGVSFSGGVGTIQGVVIGAIILQAINYSLQFLGVNPYLQYIIRGLIIILAVAIDVRKYLVKK